MSSQMDALVKKHSTSSMAACTGFFTMIMASADTVSIEANTQKRISTSIFSPTRLLSIRRVSGLVGTDQRVVTLAHGEQFVLGHDVLAAIFHVVFVDTREHDGIDGARLFTEAAVD